MLHLDLFSGIGGFALAADRVFGNVKHIFVENDLFCQRVLKKNWPSSEIHGDIRTFIADTERGGCVHGESEIKPAKPDKQALSEPPADFRAPFILTGGFPCQPFSQAGRRKGTEDDRYLWPEMFRVIQLTKLQWVIAENVRGLVTWNNGMVLEQVCADLESEGYAVQPFIIPAVAVNAPHRRDRVWIVAHKSSLGRVAGSGNREGGHILRNKERGAEKGEPQRDRRERGIGEVRVIENTISKRSRRRSENGRQVLERESPEVQTARPDSEGGDAPNATDRRRGQCVPVGEATENISQSSERNEWNKNWLEVATEFCSVDDGFSVELDGLKLSKSKHRAEQLKAYGNAIVPQVAVEIMKAIKQTPNS